MSGKFICLASGSKSRKSLLERSGLNIEVISADIDETLGEEGVEDYVLRLSKEKASATINKTKSQVIVAADSVAYFEGEIIGKPKDREDALRIIKKLSGNTHVFVTGMCVIKVEDQSIEQIVNKTEVKLQNLTNDQIEAYVDKVKPYTFAGGYSTDKSSWLIESINGSISNLMGLPMSDLFKIFRNLDLNWSDYY